jgi:hypothetical protein
VGPGWDDVTWLGTPNSGWLTAISPQQSRHRRQQPSAQLIAYAATDLAFG